MKGELYIYGCGGHARSIINTALDTYTKKDIIVIDQNLNEEENILGCKSLRQNLSWKEKRFIVGIGDNKDRAKDTVKSFESDFGPGSPYNHIKQINDKWREC